MGHEPKSVPRESTPIKERQLTRIAEKLESDWVTAIQELGIGTDSARPAFDNLLARYAEGNRSYHNLSHIKEMLDFLRSHASAIQGMPQVVLAVFFHDAIYDSQAKDNEEQSAALVQELMKPLGLAPNHIETIASLVQSTKKHQPILEGMDNKLFLDADLAILGSAHEKYLQYSDSVREEYSWVPEPDYVAGRKGVLEAFLKRSEIYLTQPVRAELEARARDNIAAEIKLLGGPSA